MKKTTFLYSDKYQQFQQFSGRLNRMLADRSFYQLSQSKQAELTGRLRRLYRQLTHVFAAGSLRKILAGAATVVLTLGTASLSAQNFQKKGQNMFGLQPVGDNAIPVMVDIDGDGDLDIFSGEYSQNLVFFENKGTASSPQFATAVKNPFGFSGQLYYMSPSFADLDNDGDLDMIITDYENGDIYFYKNNGTATAPAFAASVKNPFQLKQTEGNFASALADLDGDGDYDILSGVYDYDTYAIRMRFYENIGTKTQPAFATPVDDPFSIPSTDDGYIYWPVLVDIDKDGDLDIFSASVYYSGFLYFENTGTATAPKFGTPVVDPFGLDGKTIEDVSIPAFGDLDNDGDMDLLTGEYYGDFFYYENNGPAGIARFSKTRPATISPNPVTDHFNLQVPKGGKFTLTITDVAGRTLHSEEITISEGETKQMSRPALPNGANVLMLDNGSEKYRQRIVLR